MAAWATVYLPQSDHYSLGRAVRESIGRTYACALAILATYLDRLHCLAAALIEQETLDQEQIAAVLDPHAPGAHDPSIAHFDTDARDRGGRGVREACR